MYVLVVVVVVVLFGIELRVTVISNKCKKTEICVPRDTIYREHSVTHNLPRTLYDVHCTTYILLFIVYIEMLY